MLVVLLFAPIVAHSLKWFRLTSIFRLAILLWWTVVDFAKLLNQEHNFLGSVQSVI